MAEFGLLCVGEVKLQDEIVGGLGNANSVRSVRGIMIDWRRGLDRILVLPIFSPALNVECQVQGIFEMVKHCNIRRTKRAELTNCVGIVYFIKRTEVLIVARSTIDK